jgi:4-hydroxybenzoyl-CoA thioesterase
MIPSYTIYTVEMPGGRRQHGPLARPQRKSAMFTNTHSLTVEWGDCDPAGIVFYPRFFAMFDAATACLLAAASGMSRAELIRYYDILGWPMVDTRSTFRAPVTFDDRITIDGRITRVGTSSFEIEHRLLKQGQLCVECSEVRVWTAKPKDGMPMRATPIPDALRTALETPRN